jgi:hypothetical protein
MALPAILGGIAGVYLGGKLADTSAGKMLGGYVPSLALIGAGYYWQRGKGQAWRDAGSALVGVGAGMAFQRFGVVGMGSTVAAMNAPTVKGVVGEYVQFDTRMDPMYTGIRTT